ncbi:SAM-dependent methyltransferase, partial [Nguyenibacter vanlangensis]|nr:SAM-dependent methyltransferase [Nguyenibacter vanlangensis]
QAAPAGLFPAALAAMMQEDGGLSVPLRVAIMTGWSPDAGQPKPLRPGQFTTPLEDALKNIG